jgi:hypothetical protein
MRVMPPNGTDLCLEWKGDGKLHGSSSPRMDGFNTQSWSQIKHYKSKKESVTESMYVDKDVAMEDEKGKREDGLEVGLVPGRGSYRPFRTICVRAQAALVERRLGFGHESHLARRD